MNLLLVAFGGALGSVARYLMGGWVYTLAGKPEFPLGTFVVNMIGCFVIGVLNQFAESQQIVAPQFRLLLIVGFMGGFTTFSSFGYETVDLLREGETFQAIANAVLQVVIGLSACAFGIWLGRMIWGES